MWISVSLSQISKEKLMIIIKKRSDFGRISPNLLIYKYITLSGDFKALISFTLKIVVELWISS